jgi:radical SAM protein with 4Fe4S-binding SPASM domain
MKIRAERLMTLRALLRRPTAILHYAGVRISFRLKLRRVIGLPIAMAVEPGNVCNFKCRHCQVSHRNARPVQLSVDGFQHIIGQLPQLLRLKLQGMGEPLLVRGFLSMLEAGEKRGIAMRFITNGSLCDEAVARRLARLDRTRVVVSMDGASSEVFEQIRTGSSFGQVTENVRRLVAQRGGRAMPRIELRTLVTAQNVRELPDIVRLSKELGIDALTFEQFVTNWGKSEMDEYVSTVRVAEDSPELDVHLDRATQLAKELGVHLRVARAAGLYSRRHQCCSPWTEAFIDAAGDVVPCSVVADSKTIQMGNVFDRSFSEIWNSKVYQDLRDRIRRHDLPSFCRNCYSDP